MSKEETPPAEGLLSKMVRFVRNPTVQWTELDSLQDDKESQYSKQMLKEMIERKRRNDFVRRREFDQLRKLRKREALHGQRTEDPTNRPSFFQSSMASPDERAVTLKKIDEIEAQMSQQWWKSKQSDSGPTMPSDLASVPASVPASAAAHGPDTEAAADARAFAPTAPVSLAAPLSPASPVAPLFADDSMKVGGFGATDARLHADTVPAEPAFSQTVPGIVPSPAPAAAPVAALEKFVHEPDLEEAAIRFANGDYEGAESGLLEVLQQHRQDDPEQQFDLWMTLFDLYRATGQHDRFDALAIDFAAQYSRSAPLWFSLPEQLGLAAAASEVAEGPARRDFSWSAPQRLAVSSVAALQASVERAASPWTLSWTRISSIDDAAVPLLADLFTKWADKKGQFVFSGVDRLNTLMEVMTQSGDRASGPEWWRLRMSALRLMGRLDEFELVALDYCVTYEVSPPSWIAPQCGYSGDDPAASAEQAKPNERDMLASDFGDLSLPMPLDAGPVVALSGVIEGDATPMLEPFQAMMRQGVPLPVSCDKLMRIDFAAAGSVLNWAAEQQAQGHVVHFQNLHRLIAVFFNVIGVNEHAWVIPRKN
ncbi:STAS domain-containing protein [Acidovorax sp. DW039]|uniref:STAS domain-containing protein n=1 Tax=Acidovorax sp. DW039 TaxID=3095606 RepID=UPI0030934ABB|nr:STAS domain-containing protein [Acidovorax sp. DW039]